MADVAEPNVEESSATQPNSAVSVAEGSNAGTRARTPEIATHDAAARGGFYHVVLRGSRCEALFSTPADRRALNVAASDAMQRFDAVLHGYCLLPHQFRVLMQVKDRRLIKTLRTIAGSYARYKHKMSGTENLFEKPFDACRIETGWEFLQLLRAIHLSPVTANKVVTPDDYQWSSHRAYLGFASVARVTTSFGLSLLSAESSLARVAYHRFIAEGLAADTKPKDFRLGRAQEATPAATARSPSDPFLVRVSEVRIGDIDRARFRGGRKRNSNRRYLAVY